MKLPNLSEVVGILNAVKVAKQSAPAKPAFLSGKKKILSTTLSILATVGIAIGGTYLGLSEAIIGLLASLVTGASYLYTREEAGIDKARINSDTATLRDLAADLAEAMKRLDESAPAIESAPVATE